MGQHKQIEKELFGVIPVEKCSTYSGKTIIGLSFKQRWGLCWISILQGLMLLIKWGETSKQLITMGKTYANVAQIIIGAAAPSPELLAQEVAKRPYEPFGAPGITDTTKFDGNLAEQFKGHNAN